MSITVPIHPLLPPLCLCFSVESRKSSFHNLQATKTRTIASFKRRKCLNSAALGIHIFIRQILGSISTLIKVSRCTIFIWPSSSKTVTEDVEEDDHDEIGSRETTSFCFNVTAPVSLRSKEGYQ